MDVDWSLPSIFGWAADEAGCGYYRLGLPFWAMRELHGYPCEASTLLPYGAKDHATIIVGQRVCIEGASVTWQKLAKADRKLVFEVDDDLWHIHPSNELSAEFFSRRDVKQRLAENARAASLITVTNEHLAEIVSEFNDNVAIIPNYVPSSILDIERKPNERLTIGWSGSLTHLVDFESVLSPLRRFLRQHPEIDMHIIGGDYTKMFKWPTRYTPWSKEVVEYYRSVDFDIGVIPLADDYFNRSKSYIKALEYGALGIPIVASNSGPYRDYVVHGVTGFLVNHGWEWGKYLNMLANDEEMRVAMGHAAKALARENTIEDNINKWIDAYSSLL